jgi:hypothetical protein
MQTTRERHDVVPPDTHGLEARPVAGEPLLIGAVMVLQCALIAS